MVFFKGSSVWKGFTGAAEPIEDSWPEIQGPVDAALRIHYHDHPDGLHDNVLLFQVLPTCRRASEGQLGPPGREGCDREGLAGSGRGASRGTNGRLRRMCKMAVLHPLAGQEGLDVP